MMPVEWIFNGSDGVDQEVKQMKAWREELNVWWCSLGAIKSLCQVAKLEVFKRISDSMKTIKDSVANDPSPGFRRPAQRLHSTSGPPCSQTRDACSMYVI